MCPELEGAFQNHFADDELALRNPAKAALAHSALGRILAAVFELAQSEDYGTFSTFVRSGDVARWAAVTLGLTPGEVADYVAHGVQTGAPTAESAQTVVRSTSRVPSACSA